MRRAMGRIPWAPPQQFALLTIVQATGDETAFAVQIDVIKSFASTLDMFR